MVVLLVGAAAFAQPFTGRWSSASGELQLSQAGAEVKGAFALELGHGRLRGRVEGETLRGTWAASADSGAFVATVSGRTLSLTLDDGEPVSFKRVDGARLRNTRAVAKTSLHARAAELPAAPVALDLPQAPEVLRGGLCSPTQRFGSSWVRRYSFDGRGHMSVGVEVPTRRRSLVPSARQFWVDDVGTYLVRGSVVTIRLGRELVVCLVGNRVDDGAVTELQCGDRLYGAALCTAAVGER